MTDVLFIDIDGTLLYHEDEFLDSTKDDKASALPGVPEKIGRWHCDGYIIVLVTARPESMRKVTKKQLAKAGIVYNQLVMGIGAGKRYLFNDNNPEKPDVNKAIAINLPRNKGIADVIL